MVPEVTIICIDNSYFFHQDSSMVMRHQADAFQLYSCVKIQHNPKNTVGVFTLCKKKHQILLPPTNDLGKIRTFKRHIEALKPGGLMKFEEGLDMATMGFMCGDNENLKRRLVVFAVGFIIYSEKNLQELGNSLKMNNIALDIVMVGSHFNAERIKSFVAAVNNNRNSHILYVASAPSICQAILSPHCFPHFEEELRRLAARGTISMQIERATQKKKAAMYCDEMNKKDNRSTKPGMTASQLVALLLKSTICFISDERSLWLICVVHVFLLLNSFLHKKC